MGTCVYCGQDAGLLRRRHSECHRRARLGRAQIASLAADAALAPLRTTALLAEIDTIKRASQLEAVDIKPPLVAGWEQAARSAMSGDIPTRQQADSLIAFAREQGLPHAGLDRRGTYTKLIKAAVLRDVLEGRTPQRVQIQGSHPFNMQKDEVLVWVFRDVKYYERRTRTQYTGRSQGFSVRVARGVYYREGGFRGEPVKTTETVFVGKGIMGVTNKHVYFASPDKTMRIRYDRIVSFRPHCNGIEIQRDAQSAKPQSFVTGDGWFTYNLITNLASL